MLSGFLLTPASACLGGLWRMLAVTKICVQSALFVVRLQDYHAPAGARRKVQAQGEGKLATFAVRPCLRKPLSWEGLCKESGHSASRRASAASELCGEPRGPAPG